ncbi:MAG: chorismate synthase [candidate division Zixibacteria bacterium]|nr:chorismate synthase [candidate division Zixibacteria bacterium]
MRYLTAGESHGPALTTIVEGLPAGLSVSATDIDTDLKRRQGGYGRGKRMQIETDTVEILGGIRHGKTLGGPVAMIVRNDDWPNWTDVMAVEPVDEPATRRRVTRPRPGHADLAGGLKYGHRDLRNVLERASARETTMRVAVGAIAKRLLAEFGMRVVSHVVRIGAVEADVAGLGPDELWERAERSPVRCADERAAASMITEIDRAKSLRDTVGGVFEVRVIGAPPGLGSHVHWDRKLDGRLAQAVMSIQAVKGVEIGMGFGVTQVLGSEVHDEIYYDNGEFYRKTNRAGGVEGGMSFGDDIVVRGALKPIATLMRTIMSVDIETKEPFDSAKERSDVCTVPAAGVIGEAVVALVIADAMQEKFGGDSVEEMRRNYDAYMEQVKGY